MDGYLPTLEELLARGHEAYGVPSGMSYPLDVYGGPGVPSFSLEAQEPPIRQVRPTMAQRIGEALGMAQVQYQPRRGASGLENFAGRFLEGAARSYGGHAMENKQGAMAFNMSERAARAEKNRRNIEASESARKMANERWTKTREAAEKERAALAKEQRENAESDRRALRDEGLLRGRPKGGGAASNMSDEDAEAIADAIMRGDQPPTLSGLYRNAGPVRAALARRKYDLTRAGLDYESAKRHYASANGTIQMRLRQASENARGSIEVARELNDKLSELVRRSNIEALNRPLLWTARNLGNTEAAALATQLQGQIPILQSELSNVFQGGGAPTDEARKMAQQMLRSDMSPRNLSAALDLALRDVGVRLAAIRDVQAVSPSSPLGGETVVGGRTIVGRTNTGRRIRVQSPDGTKGTIDESELAEAEANGWRRIE